MAEAQKKSPRRDPLGKQYLYLAVGSEQSEQESLDLGRKALFSSTEDVRKKSEAKAPLKLHCSNCDTTSYVELIEFFKLCLPISIWLPFRSHSRLMMCPGCHTRSWIRVQVTLLANELSEG
jgi:hypothetical protein